MMLQRMILVKELILHLQGHIFVGFEDDGEEQDGHLHLTTEYDIDSDFSATELSGFSATEK